MALCVKVCGAYLGAKWIGSLCLCCMMYGSWQDVEYIDLKQDRQCTYNVTLKRLLAAIVAVEK